jgi:hypothetical protein
MNAYAVSYRTLGTTCIPRCSRPYEVHDDLS